MRKKKIDEIALSLQLEKALDVPVGSNSFKGIKGISGGERKRTSIAFELVSDSKVIFLDEPTSGLDSLTCYVIVNHLKTLAKTEGKTVVMSIHQPNRETYELFDRLILLAGGKIIYQGRASKAELYFQDELGYLFPKYSNPPDFIMSKIHPES